jgi:hypothetical protein
MRLLLQACRVTAKTACHRLQELEHRRRVRREEDGRVRD